MRPNLGVLRSAVAPLLTETGTVEKVTGTFYDPTADGGNGAEVQARENVYTGPLLIAPSATATVTEEVGGRTASVEQYDVTLPAETAVEIGDLVTLTVAPTDPSFLDVEFILTGVDLDPWAVARFCRAERHS